MCLSVKKDNTKCLVIKNKLWSIWNKCFYALHEVVKKKTKKLEVLIFWENHWHYKKH